MFNIFKKSPVSMQLNPPSFAAASSAVVAIWYSIIAVLLALNSSFIAQWWARTHYLKNVQDVTDFMAHFQVTLGGFVIGLIFHIVFIYAIAYGFAVLYNRTQR